MTSPAQLFDLSGKVALVTGGSRGLGRSMVVAFAEAGADVIIVSRKQENCDELAAEVEASTGRQAMAYGCNVTHWDDLDGLVDAAYARFGKVDVLVNNAGASPLYPDVQSITESLFDKVLALNLKAPFRLGVLVGTRMAQGDGGSIINVSAIGAKTPNPTVIPYTCAKAGLNTLTVSLAQALGPSVRVNCIMPGAFRTDISKHWDMAAYDEYTKAWPLRRIGEPDEIVGAALYLASAASSYTSGSIITVDGGAIGTA